MSNAVFWGEGLNHWANPALLGYQRGVRYEWGKTQLVPGLASDVFFETDALKLGGGGLSFTLSGAPFDVGGLRLDYGESHGVDEQGNPTGTFGSFEDIDSWGFGFSLARLGESLARIIGREPPQWSRAADMSFGMGWKEVDVSLAPFPGGRAGTSSRDRGLLIRVSPTERFAALHEVPWTFDVAYRWSDLSYSG